MLHFHSFFGILYVLVESNQLLGCCESFMAKVLQLY
jgi:hypothetical protein